MSVARARQIFQKLTILRVASIVVIFHCFSFGVCQVFHHSSPQYKQIVAFYFL